LATAGLDRKVRFWDLRKFGSNSNRHDPKEPKGAFLGEHETKKSVNSAFFSPSGSYMVTTTMSDTLNIYKNAHLQAGGETKKGKKGVLVTPEHVIRHNNQTGRWLTTFMAQWHPARDIFCVGSMQKPRAIDIFDGASGENLRAVEGEALTAVASRCCFHPSTDKLILVGGNSSGRVAVVR
jgi:WD repeat-containing protein 76